ncbi:hypothetical protein [Luteolibacter sp. LG18]|uniref:hypothetical protein n=1 Tax=Luteolibacter sp. LG18 TaxID=2819286 RepID=UPI002B30FF9F|nr:hypothetical protein llg_07250 [Luteolibacter sp. LG18]BCU79646.1 hypothetical protein llg_43610 [Luteolibacter sp. LG18]
MSDDRTPEQLAFDQRVLSLHQRQASGEVPPPGRISQRQLARELGMTIREIQRAEALALEAIRRSFITRTH